ncbi:MAG: hypothetical protein ACMUIU_01380 [bacterium]
MKKLDLYREDFCISDPSLIITLTQPSTEWHQMIVICPPFGRKRENLALLAATLAVNGYANVRIDLRNHVGESSGTSLEFTLSQVLTDLYDTTLWIRNKWPHIRLHLLTMSLSTRPATRFIAKQKAGKEYSSFSAFVPVLDIRHVVHKASGKDYFQTVIDGKYEEGIILDQPVSSLFVFDARSNGMEGAEDSLKDLQEIYIPVRLFAATEDEWVDYEELKWICKQSHENVLLINVDNARHNIGKNLAAARITLEKYIHELNKLDGFRKDFIKPSILELVLFSRSDRKK